MFNFKPIEDKLADAKRQGQAQFDSIREMVEALQAAEKAAWSNAPTQSGDYDDANEDARRAIEEDALSVEVRSAWVSVRNWSRAHGDQAAPAEYQILLCTGGPACRIVGTLNEHCEPETAVMEIQDWFTPWTAYCPDMPEHGEDQPGLPEHSNPEEVMLAYARCFWFGE